ncbi:hypothetical protein DV735_g4278, partial [Chaetothyriales sp. CBS 134920]
MAVTLELLDLGIDENDIFLSHLGADDILDPALSSPSECPSLGESFTGCHNFVMTRELSRRTSLNSSPTSPGWCSMKTPSPVPLSGQLHEPPFEEDYQPGTKLDFDEATMLNMMHFGLVESETWSHQPSSRIGPGLGNTPQHISIGLGIQNQADLSQEYAAFPPGFAANAPLSKQIFGLDQVMHNSARTDERFITWPACTTAPRHTAQPSSAFDSALASPSLRRPEEPPRRGRTSALSTGLLKANLATWVSPPMLPSQHNIDNELQYETADHAVMSSDSASNSSPIMDRRWSAATASDAGNGTPSLRRRGHEHRRRSGPSRKSRPEPGKSGIDCDAVIAHNEFACSWPNCIDKATGKQKRFKRQEHKKRHEKTVHEKEGSYRCWVPGCTTTAFTRTDNLKSHLRNTHGKKSPNQRNRYVATQDKNSECYDPDWQGDLTEDGYPIFTKKRATVAMKTNNQSSSGPTPRDAEATVAQGSQSPGAEPVKSVPISNFWRILALGKGIDHLLLSVGLLCSVGAGVAMPLMNIVFGTLVSDFNSYFIPNTSTTKAEFLHSVSQSSLYIVYLFIGKFVLSYIGAFCFRIAGLRISSVLRLNYMRALFSKPISKLDETSLGSVSNTITSSANSILLGITEKLSLLFQSLAIEITACIIAFKFSWKLTLVASSCLLFCLVFYSITIPRVVKAGQGLVKADEKHATIAGEIFSSIRTVLSLGAGKPLSEKYYEWVAESRKRGLKFAPLVAVQMSPSFFILYCSFSLTFWFGLKLFRSGDIDINAVVIVIFSIIMVISSLSGAVVPLLAISQAISASASFFDMIDSPSLPGSGLKPPEASVEGDIVFNSVTFSYPTRTKVRALVDFSAVFEKGKTTALVGPSGSGKSTIVALLERWYELSSQVVESGDNNAANKEGTGDAQVYSNGGTITVCGQDITAFDVKWWRTQIGLVSQEPFLFNDTICNNVAYGLKGTQWEHVSESEKLQLVAEACKEAFADEFIIRLPQAYSTVVGESGIKLSGGQRQRIAIARSIVRKPQILILDEATSSVDVRSEKIVQAALDRISKSRTTIVIAHRLSTIRQADSIIVVRDGVKIEEGSHEYLMSIQDGLYNALVNAQQIESHAVADEAEAGDAKPSLPRSDTKSSLDVTLPEEHNTRSPDKKGSFFSSVGLLMYEQRQHWWLYLLTILSAMGAGAAFPLQAWIFSKLIEVFTFTGRELIRAGNHWSLMFFILAIEQAISYFFLGYASTAITHHVAAAYRVDYFNNILRQPISFFDAEGNDSGSLMARLSGDPKLLYEILGLNGGFVLMSIFSLLGCVIISLCFGWKLSLVAIFAIMPVLMAASFVRIRHEANLEEINSKVFASSSQFATEAISAVRTVTSLTMEDSIVRRYSALLSDQIRQSTRKASYSMIIYALTDSVELAGMALAFWYGGQLLGRREYDPVQFFVIYTALVQASQVTGQFFAFLPNIAQSTAGATRILALRALNTVDASTEPPRLPISDTTNLGAAIEFDRVSFKYPTRSTPIFINLSLSIPGGSYVAFVGPSGVGKSTVISLLERFYEPSSGTITYDGTDISCLELSSYRSAISLVAQEPKLFDGTIKENLLLGLPTQSGNTTTNNNDDDVHKACKDAEIHDFILSLPEGYDTPLGLNSATALSGGQKQRLCLARALLRKPKLLLLDEATSSLDSQSEKLVQTAIERLAAGRGMTVVAVAHRLATVQQADCIFVLGEGANVESGARLLEKGTHVDLLAMRGIYWQMCQGQALDA